MIHAPRPIDIPEAVPSHEVAYVVTLLVVGWFLWELAGFCRRKYFK
jgi:hypothetical protein